MTRILLWVPLTLFALFLVVVATGIIKPTDHVIHSRMVGKAVPTFSLEPMLADKPGVTSAVFEQGKPRLLNVFASWCVPCIAEAPHLMTLKRRGVEIDAVAIRDSASDVRAFLKRNGDPYARIGDDGDASVQLALGSSGVPETFVIDGEGNIVLQHVGAVRGDDIPEIMAALEKVR